MAVYNSYVGWPFSLLKLDLQIILLQTESVCWFLREPVFRICVSNTVVTSKTQILQIILSGMS